MDGFNRFIVANPTDHYAQFGLGLAAEHLALAAAMRPDLPHYRRALRAVRVRRGPAEELP